MNFMIIAPAAAAMGAILLAAPAAAQTSPPAQSAPAATPALPPPVPFDQALLKAANDLLSKAAADIPNEKILLAIDPLIDGVTGAQSVATRNMERRIVELVKKTYPRFDVQPFNTATVTRQPIVLIGTFTPINAAGQAGAPKDAFRICLALADLKTKRIVSKGFARSTPDGIDATPTGAFTDAPVWAKDDATDAYVKSCQGTKAGDPLNQVYTDRILAAALISDAITAYDNRRYAEALDLYNSAVRTPGGDQLRAFNGIYLANWKLGRRQAAAEAFGKVVDFGMANNRLAVRFLFRPGSTLLMSDKTISQPYPIWVSEIAKRAGQSTACLEIVGHTSPTGPAPLNERLSVLRAEHVKDKLQAEVPTLGKRVIATGMGSRENLVGTGKDNPSDALDRRVEFKVFNC